MQNTTITITFGEQGENDPGMETLGKGLAQEGFSVEDLRGMKTVFDEAGYKTQLINLNAFIRDQEYRALADEQADILIIRNGVEALLENDDATADMLFDELVALDWDSRAKQRGRVVNKNARHNLMFANEAQEPDYEAGKGRIVPFSAVPLLASVDQQLPEYFGSKAKGLVAEGNLYYNVRVCGIGPHGDSERKRVVAFRLGASMPLQYQWYYRGQPLQRRVRFTVHSGDIYVMSEKATGFDWKKKSIMTLRHAAGCADFLEPKVKKIDPKPSLANPTDKAMNTFYRLKMLQENKFIAAKKRVMKSSLSPGDKRKRIALIREKRPIKFSVGRTLKSVGAPNKTMSIKRGQYGLAPTLLEEQSEVLKRVKTKIIRTKLDILFGLETHQDEETFEKLKGEYEELNKVVKSLEGMIEALNVVQIQDITGDRTIPRETLVDLDKKRLGGLVKGFRQSIEDYKKESNASRRMVLLEEAISGYVDSIVPLARQIQDDAYDVVTVDQEDDGTFRLIQVRTTLRRLQVEIEPPGPGDD